MSDEKPGKNGARGIGQMSTTDLLKEISGQSSLLIKKEIDLAKAELKADIRNEAFMAGGLGIALSGVFLAVSMFFVTIILILSEAMPFWIAGMIVCGFLLFVSLIAGLIGWSKRVRSPFKRVQATIHDDIVLAKEKLA